MERRQARHVAVTPEAVRSAAGKSPLTERTWGRVVVVPVAAMHRYDVLVNVNVVDGIVRVRVDPGLDLGDPVIDKVV